MHEEHVQLHDCAQEAADATQAFANAVGQEVSSSLVAFSGCRKVKQARELLYLACQQLYFMVVGMVR